VAADAIRAVTSKKETGPVSDGLVFLWPKLIKIGRGPFDRRRFRAMISLLLKKGRAHEADGCLREESRSLDLLSEGGFRPAAKAGYSVPMPCGGCGRCGKCRIRAEGKISPATAQERLLLTKEDSLLRNPPRCETEALGTPPFFFRKT
jgi:hypothetical protein